MLCKFSHICGLCGAHSDFYFLCVFILTGIETSHLREIRTFFDLGLDLPKNI